MNLTKFSPIIILLSLIFGLFVGFFKIFSNYILLMLGVIIWVACLDVKPSMLFFAIKKPKKHALFLFLLFIVQPIITFYIVSIFINVKLIVAGFVIAASAPTASAVVFWTKLAKGDTSLALTFIGISQLLTPFVFPLISYLLLSSYLKINLLNMFYTLILVTIFPMILAFLTTKFIKIKKFQNFLESLSLIILFILLASVVSLNAKNIFTTGYFFLMIGVATFQVASNFTLSYIFSYKWVISEAKVLILSITTRNTALAMAIALVNFGALSALPSAFLMIVQAVFVSFFIEQKINIS